MPVDADVGPVAKQMLGTLVSQHGVWQKTGDNRQGGSMKIEPRNPPYEVHELDIFLVGRSQDVQTEYNYGNGAAMGIPPDGPPVMVEAVVGA